MWLCPPIPVFVAWIIISWFLLAASPKHLYAVRDVPTWDNEVSTFYSNLNSTCLDDMYCSEEDCRSEIHPMVAFWPISAVKFYYTKRCSCHSSCLKYGLCCINFEEKCMKGEDQVSFKYDEELYETRVAERIVTCEKYDKMYKFTISKCRRPLADGVNATDVELCEGEIRNLTQIYPVFGGMDTYKNIHCAKCNGLNRVDVESDEVNIACSVDYMRRHNEDDAFVNTVNILGAIRSGECKVEYNVIFAEACAQEVVSTCNDTYKTELENFTELERACQSYTAYFTHPWVNDSVLLFQNYHCALCNGMSENVTCIGSYKSDYENIPYVPTIQVPSLMVLLDFTGETMATVQLAYARECRFESQVLDLIANECIDIPCPVGYMLQKGSTYCILNDSTSFMKVDTSPNVWHEDEICIFYREDYDLSTAPIPIDTVFNIAKNLLIDYIRRVNLDFEMELILDNTTECLDKEPTENVLKIVARVKEPKIAMFMWASDALSGAWSSLDLTVHITRVVIKTPHLSLGSGTPTDVEKVLYVSSQSLYETKNYEKIDMMFDAQEYLEIYISSYGITVDTDKIQLTTTVVNDDGNWVRSVVGAVISKELFNCTTWLQHNTSDIEPCINSSLTDREVLRNNKPIVDRETGNAYEAILTVTCSTVSIVALCVSLIVHAVFLCPLNLPTKILISLFISLLIAHAIFLVSALKVWPNIVCSIIAAVQHYSWLASFAWMNVLSCNLYVNFRSIRSKMSNESSYGRYSLYGWFLPASIVSLSAVLIHFNLFQYGAAGSCWIVGGLQLAIAFALPVSIMITVNGVFFVLLVRSLKASMEESSFASNIYDIKYRLNIHIKLFSVMGSTWILGFLSNVPQLHSLSYPFVVLACLNGLFVALCFTLNQRFFKSFKDKISTFMAGTARTD